MTGIRRSISRSLRKYTAIVRVQLSDRITYAGDLLIQSLTMVMFMWIFMQLWRVTYNANGTSTIAGLSLRETMWYLMAGEVIMLSKPRVWRVISEGVKDGSIAYLLNKPYDFLLYQLSTSLGDLLSRMLFNLLAGGAIVWLMVGPPPSLAALPMMLPLYLLAWLIDFSFSALIGLAAFATEEVAPFDWIYSKLLLVAGGVLIPLDFFPDWMQRICLSLPFAYTVYGPARWFIQPENGRLLSLLAGQFFWLALAGGALIVAYRKGLARLSINGG
jgi:ABC-2 type transport system permease protein